MKTLSMTLMLSVGTLGTASVATGQDEPRPLPAVQDLSEVQRGIDVMRRVLWKSIQNRSTDIQGFSAAASRYNRLYQEGLVSGNTLQEYVRSNYGVSSSNQGSVDYLPGLAAVVRFEMPIRGRWVLPEQEAQREEPVPPADLWEQTLGEVKTAQEGRPLVQQLDSAGVPILGDLPLLGRYFSTREAEALGAVAEGVLLDALLHPQGGQLEVDPAALRELINTLSGALAQYSRRVGLREDEDLVVSLRLTPRAAPANYVDLARLAATAGEQEYVDAADLNTLDTTAVAFGSAKPAGGGTGAVRTLVLRVPAAALKGGHEQSAAAFVSQLRVDYF